MKVRHATDADTGRIREIAEQSFQASYSLSPQDIEAISEVEFEGEALGSRLRDDEQFVLVAEENETVVGFIEGTVTNNRAGEIRWLHVVPTARGNGAGTALFEQMLTTLREQAVEEIQASVLAENAEGGEFYEQFDFESDRTRDRSYGERSVHVELYHNEITDADDDSDTPPQDREIVVDGETRYLDPEDPLSGTDNQILPVYEDSAHEDSFGFFCTNCDSYTDSYSSQGMILCDNCGNEHRPDQWDESYL